MKNIREMLESITQDESAIQRIQQEWKDRADQSFHDGIAYALARVIELYGQTEVALKIWTDAGLDRNDLTNIDEADRKYLKMAWEAEDDSNTPQEEIING